MNRQEELFKIIGEDSAFLKQLVEEVVFIENRLTELKQLPFIRVNPKNVSQQKSTPAAKLYKEFLQQYNNVIKTLFRVTGQDENDEESPLRKWVESRANSE